MRLQDGRGADPTFTAENDYRNAIGTTCTGVHHAKREITMMAPSVFEPDAVESYRSLLSPETWASLCEFEANRSLGGGS